MGHMRSKFSIAAGDRFRSLPLAATVCLLLLFAQSANLLHSHDDTHVRYDCDICLKIESSSDAIAVGHIDYPVSPVQHDWLNATPEAPFLPLSDIRSRAPPQA